jgi:hypothetical protein
MGNSASKSAKSAIKQVTTTSGRVAGMNQQPLNSHSSSSSRSTPPPRVSETKDESIMSESRDDDLAKNLQLLGQVSVPGKGIPTSSTSSLHENAMLGILQERRRIDESSAAGISTLNELSARGLSNLFDDRKSAKSLQEADQLCRDYGMDPRLIQELSKFVNSPSISRVLPSNDPDEDDRRLAKWVDAPSS